MKQKYIVGIVLLGVLTLIGCGVSSKPKTDILEERQKEDSTVKNTATAEDILVLDETDLNDKKETIKESVDKSVAIRTHLWFEDYPTDTVIEDMNSYKEFMEVYDNICEYPEFKEVFGTIDVAFFEHNILLVKIVMSGNGAQQYYVDGIGELGGQPVILDYMETENEIGTSDMSTWFLFAVKEK